MIKKIFQTENWWYWFASGIILSAGLLAQSSLMLLTAHAQASIVRITIFDVYGVEIVLLLLLLFLGKFFRVKKIQQYGDKLILFFFGMGLASFVFGGILFYLA